MIKRSAKYVCAVTAVVGLVIATHGNEIRTSEKGLLLIGNAEGCMQKPYQCPADVLTVGIGTFNVGCGRLKNSTLFKMARKGYSKAMCGQFERWIYANGVPLKGLIERRQKEKALCLGS
mgnify:CR=1 FL=1